MTSPFRKIMPALTLLLTVSGSGLTAQDFRGCRVTYLQTTRYDFTAIFGTFANHESNEWAASLPTRHDARFVLHLTQDHSLYTIDPQSFDEMPELLQQALQKADYFRAPGTVVRQVYRDFEKQETIRQVEFMTRLFRVAGPIERNAWKFTGEMIKILGYICMGAEMMEGERRITAWFTSGIPVPSGPAHYAGLPGLILALEIDGETAFLATAIDPGPPEAKDLTVPGDGKIVTREEFEVIMADKLREWKEIRNKGTSYGKK